MLKLAQEDKINNTNISENLENDIVKKEKHESRKRCLEIDIEQEREEILEIKRKIEKEKGEMILSIVLIAVSFGLFVYLGTHAVSVAFSLITRPVVVILIVGVIVKFVAYTVEHARKHIPMYIWCERERRGKETNHNNYVKQYREKEEKCREMEIELKALNDINV